jgi:hypothetical protein
VGVAGFAGGDDHHAVVGFVFEVKKPQQGDGQFGTVGCGAAEKVRSAAVVVTPVPGAEPGTADAIGGGNARQDSESGGDVEVLVPVAFVEDKGGDLEVGAGGPQSALGLDCPCIELSAMSAWLGKSCPCACQGSLACDLDRVAVDLGEQGGAPPTVIGPLERRHLHDLQGVAGPGGD